MGFSRRWAITAALFLGLSVDAEPGQAFEAWGFKSGMTQEQAIAVADQQGYAQPNPQQPSAVGFQHLFFGPKAIRVPDGSLNLNGYGLAFCRDHLVSINLEYKPTMGNLMDILESLTHQYGSPTVEASAEILNDGRLRSMKFKFPPKPEDNVWVSINGSQNSETEFNIQVFHDVPFRCESKSH